MKRSAAHWLLSTGVLALLSAGAPSTHACQICIPLPQSTLADRILESQTVVLAREDPVRRFHYAVVEVLKGDPGHEAIDTFMNSQARRALAADPVNAMVLAHVPGGTGWSALGIVRDGDFEAVIRQIVARENWLPRESVKLARVTEFARLLGHTDRRLHELAFLEVGRAPYALIKQVSPEVSLGTVRAMLDDYRYAEWHSLAILMLAQSKHAADRDRVYTQLDVSNRLGLSRNLAAWASACIEIDGVDGLRHIEALYVSDTRRSREEIEQIVLALSTLGASDASLRDRIVGSYRTLLNADPKLAPRFVQDLIAWHRWDFVEEYRRIKRGMNSEDPLSNYSVNLYLRAASVRATLAPVELR